MASHTTWSSLAAAECVAQPETGKERVVLTFSLLVGACALPCWPDRSAFRRLRAFVDATTGVRVTTEIRTQRGLTLHPFVRVLPAVAGVAFPVVVMLCCGFGAGLAVGMGAATTFQSWRVRNATRERLTAANGMVHALGGLVAELRSGAPAALAAASVAADAEGVAAEIMGAMACAAQLGGEVEPVLSRADNAADIVGLVHSLGRAWTLAHR